MPTTREWVQGGFASTTTESLVRVLAALVNPFAIGLVAFGDWRGEMRSACQLRER